MKKYRIKKIVLFLIIAMFIVMGISFVLIYLKNNKKDNLEVLKIVKVDTDLEMQYFPGIIYNVENNDIKYVIHNEDTIEFNSYNIDSQITKKIGVLREYDYCYESVKSIVCYKNDIDFESAGDYFSYDMKKLKKKKIDNSINYSAIFETKKGIVKEDGEKLYLADKEVMSVQNLGFLLEVFETKNDLYYLFSKDYKYVVVKNSNHEIIEMPYSNYYKYNDGYIFRTNNEFEIYNLKKNKRKKYNYRSIQEHGGDYVNLAYKDELLVIDSNNSRIIFEQLNTGDMFVYNFNDISNISNAKIINNYLIFSGETDEYPTINILNLELLKREYMPYEEYINKLAKENTKTIKRIKDKYNVNILTKNDYKNNYDVFDIEYMEDENIIKRSLKTLEKVISEYKKETFDYLVDDNYSGLYIYIVGNIITIGDDAVSSAAGFTLEEEDKHLIILDSRFIGENDLKHELFHTFERTIVEKEQFRPDLTDYNPKDFTYSYDYNVYVGEKYVKKDNEANDNVYFSNGYATTFDTEDMATTYESVCMGNVDLTKFPKIAKKFNYLKDCMVKYIPSLAESKCFINNK